ncbi:coenzyme F390 synthetase [Kocuria dechangensis]|uniref:Coenzyme F390 synthetase n=1 Tax=Kocuria dechangensis TaxID=1176249 RepID=A0A917GZM9_9MICC|nr:phenylacetate--CoA ligase family protein [Kocuria dechangensis]GGG62997.1 coenzyme F390 synthetase [Kocuria dechangensis]
MEHDGWRALAVAWDTWWVEHAGTEALARRQRARLAALVRHARRSSPYYRRLYRDVPADVEDPRLLPPVTKRELMAHFDEWVTDPEVTLEALRRDFLADGTMVGRLYLGRYRAFTSSGSTGVPVVLLHDRSSWTVMNVVVRVRARRSLLTARDLPALLRHGLREAVLVATGGHFGGVVVAEDARRRSRLVARRVRVLSVLRPLPDLVAELNAFRPTALLGYPSAIALLAAEQDAGRLRIAPLLALTSGEALTAAARGRIAAALGCRVLEQYSASEAPGLAVGCRHGTLHVSTDRYLFEPVDERHRPVPPGVVSHTVLVTDLTNRVQPVIRYDLGDRVLVLPRPCPCGSPLPAVRVEGRSGDVLVFRAAGGGTVAVLPLALGTVVGETPGVRRFQAVRTTPETLSVRLDPEPGTDPAALRAAVDARLRAFLAERGLGTVSVEHSDEPPRPDRSGKFHEVRSA